MHPKVRFWVHFCKIMNALKIVHEVIEKFVAYGDTCIDATAGRGYDAAFLSELVGDKGRVIAFDIQEEAVRSTEALLKTRGLRAEVHLDTHAHMADYADPNTVACVVFNLGYLPGGDHTVFTHATDTIPAIEAALTLLKDGGLLAVTIYSGGVTGYAERDAVIPYLKSLDSDKYQVLGVTFDNWKGDFPRPYFIIKNP